ncbi:MAG: SIS domain-containing protein [Anaerolineae bacterium]|nr:SIS domain-containing protein [Anaerolineae bacterium]
MLEQTHLYREIHEQPRVLAELLDAEQRAIAHLAADIERRAITHCVIAGRGTSDNAGRYAQYLLGSVNGLTVGLATPSLHTIYGRPPRYRDALVIGISQSGKSPDIVAVVAEARRQGALTAAITNFPDSDLGRAADHVIALHAGIEQAVAATKTYTAELAAIALLSATLAGDQGMFDVLRRVPDQVAQCLQLAPEILQRAERYRYMRVCVVIGRGYNYATAFETALKIKELTYVVAEPYSSADFMHGPVALIEQAFPTIVIAPSGQMLPEMRAFVESLRARGAEVIAIGDDVGMLAQARTAFRLPVAVPEWVSPLVAIVPGQLFAMALAQVRDLDVDQPRGLQKVTETR